MSTRSRLDRFTPVSSSPGTSAFTSSESASSRLDPRLFYKHRGLERAAEGRPLGEALAYAERACAACAVTNTVAYANAVEQRPALAPDRELRIGRTVLLELERLYNHLHDISAICAGVGYRPGTMAFAALKDRAQRSTCAPSGHRFLFDTVRVGGGGAQLAVTAAGAALGDLRELRVEQCLCVARAQVHQLAASTPGRGRRPYS